MSSVFLRREGRSRADSCGLIGSGTATTGTSATGAGAATTSSSKAAGVNNAPYIASAGGLVGLFLAFVAL